MHYGAIKNCDIANGAGVRISLFVSGCRNACKGCFQPQTWDFMYGEEYTQEVENKILEYLSPNYIRGLTLLGGDPMEPENQEPVLKLCKKVRQTYPTKDIWCFTGFTWEMLNDKECRAHTATLPDLLNQIDVLIEGPFMENLKNLSLQFRGSSNQRIIDLPQTLDSGEIILWDGK